MKRFTRGVLFTAALLCLGAARLEATTVIEKDLSDLCNEADKIFVGKVVSVESGWRDESQKAIQTVVTFAVLEPVYGVDGGEVKLTFAGGEAGGIREVVAGMPEFHPGEEVMVFASDQPSLSPIIGFHQGCFRVVDGDSGKVVLDVESRPVGLQGRALSFGKRDNGTQGAVSLDQFLDTVRTHVGQRGKGTP